MNRTGGYVCTAAFFLLLGIVGAVERGADLRLLWASLPLLLVLAAFAFRQRREQKK